MTKAVEIESLLISLGDTRQRDHLMRFFKTGPGQYGEGDEFLGLKVPQTRGIVKEVRGEIELDEIEKLLYNRWHEVRLCGFLLLVEMMNVKSLRKWRDRPKVKAGRKEIAEFYLRHLRQANNWDLVDLSCPYILGRHLILDSASDYGILYALSESDNLWEQRVAIVSTIELIRNGVFEPTLQISDKLLDHPHDLIHKAIGWMLREIGKKEKDVLVDYLESRYFRMPRTSLRYAIERMPENERTYWLKRK